MINPGSHLNPSELYNGPFQHYRKNEVFLSFLKDWPGKNLASAENNTELFVSESLEHSFHPGIQRGKMTGQMRSQFT